MAAAVASLVAAALQRECPYNIKPTTTICDPPACRVTIYWIVR
jgi:hypothetical protein